MIIKVTQTGRCLAVIIPKRVAERMNIAVGDHVVVEFIKKIVENEEE